MQMQNYVHLFSTYLEAKFHLGAMTKVVGKFSVDVRDVFIYYIWLSKLKVMGQTTSNSEN